MDYQIVATLGPSSDTDPTWQAMLAAGVTAFRLNTSHLSIPRLQEWIERLGAFLAGRQPRPPLVLDLQGSKWRLGQFPAGEYESGRRITLVCAASAADPNVLPVPHPDFFRAASASSGEIVLDDAKLRLALEALEAGTIRARVIQGGALAPRKGITYASSSYRQESLNDADRTILAETRHLQGIRYALSYVKDAAEMAGYRRQIGGGVFLIAKLERPQAVEEAVQMALSADELWLCRGDLGAELGLRGMATAVSHLSDQVHAIPVPVLLAGQVLEHMTEHPTPTRAEVCGLHAALRHGYRGFVLSDETAIGRDPVESCRVAALFRS
jgi:pyruvate kinase